MTIKTKTFKGGSLIKVKPRSRKVKGFEWKSEGAGWVANVTSVDIHGQSHFEANIILAPEGGLYGGWSWTIHLSSNGDVSGRHSSSTIAMRQAEACAESLVSLNHKIRVEEWEEFDGEVSD